MFMLGLRAMISVNNMFGVGYCIFLLIYNEKLENIIDSLLWSGLFILIIEKTHVVY